MLQLQPKGEHHEAIAARIAPKRAHCAPVAHSFRLQHLREQENKHETVVPQDFGPLQTFVQEQHVGEEY